MISSHTKPTQILLFIGVIIIAVSSYGQEFVIDIGDEEVSEKDSIFYASVIDPMYGIELYENLNHRLGGDSIRIGYKKKEMRGWYEDYYPNAQLFHRGYYTEGHLKIYKNYFPNGQLERNYKTTDSYRSTMEKFYQNGMVKSKVVYKKGLPFKWEDYYSNGNMEYYEEFNKSLDYYVMKKTFYRSGQVQTQLELVKPSKRLYVNREFFEDGAVKREGQMVFSERLWDYLKTGKWLTYDGSGKLCKEEVFINGKLNKEKSF